MGASRRREGGSGASPRFAALLLSALVSGGLHVLALPPHDHGWLAWVALVPLLAALRVARGPIAAAMLGGAFGLVSVVGVVHWIPYALVVGNEFGPRPAALIAVLVFGYYAACFALFGALARALLTWLGAGAVGAAGAVAAAAAWVAMETLRDLAVPALAWTLYGHAVHGDLVWLQLAALAGVPGLSLLLVTVNGLVAQAIAVGRGTPDRAMLAAAVALAVASSAVGGWMLRAERARDDAGQATRIGIAQLAVPQLERWQPGRAWPRVEALLAQTRAAVAAGASLVVWPETSIEVHLDKAEGLGPAVAAALGGDAGRWLLAGAPRQVGDSERARFFNSAVLVDGAGRARGVYDKALLYPVSEYVPPWMRELPLAERALRAHLQWQPYSAGSDPGPLAAGGLRVGVMICAEGVVPGPGRLVAAAGANVLAHLANDAVIPGPAAAAQHLAIVRARAVELRRPLVRASNLGTGAIFAASGRVLAVVPPGRAGQATAEVVARQDRTLYAAGGFLLPWLCVAAAPIALVVGALRAHQALSTAPRADRDAG